MNPKRKRRRILHLSMGLLLLLVGIPLGLTWRQVRQERLNHALIAAIDRNDTTAVRRLLHQGADPNAPVLPKDTRSFWQRFLDIVRHKPSPKPHTLNSALLEAVYWLPDPTTERFARMLNSIRKVDNAQAVRALVDAGANVNFRGDENVTPLMAAAECGKLETIKVLLSHHADANAKDQAGNTAIRLALGEFANTDGSFGTIFSGVTHAPQVRLLLDAGAKVNARWSMNYTPIFAAVFQMDAASTKLLLERGANLNARDTEGRTPLMIAAGLGDVEGVKLLLAHHADITLHDLAGNTALAHARKAEQNPAFCAGAQRILPLLMHAGAK